MSDPRPIVCLSHLAWERTLFQRPQQIMTRMARRGHDVLYVAKISTKRWARDAAQGRRGLHRSAPAERPAFRNLPFFPAANRLALLNALDNALTARTVRRWLGARRDAILWLYHPDTLPLVDRIPHRTLVYDVMDHFPAFQRTRATAKPREDMLLERADLVFTGGRAMHEATLGRRPGAICYPSGVEIEHFARAREATTPVPPELAALPRPVLGYFGAIDERLDFALVEEVCRQRPDWSVVFLGPVIPGTALAVSAPNFHWLGPKPYADLPSHIRGFDVCIMPWVQSALTAHISPTKTPEYLAGGKPVVSVPIRDVVRDYGDVVFFGEDAPRFIAAVESALAERDRDWAATLAGREAARTWDQIAQEMDDHVAALR